MLDVQPQITLDPLLPAEVDCSNPISNKLAYIFKYVLNKETGYKFWADIGSLPSLGKCIIIIVLFFSLHSFFKFSSKNSNNEDASRYYIDTDTRVHISIYVKWYLIGIQCIK